MWWVKKTTKKMSAFTHMRCTFNYYCHTQLVCHRNLLLLLIIAQINVQHVNDSQLYVSAYTTNVCECVFGGGGNNFIENLVRNSARVPCADSHNEFELSRKAIKGDLNCTQVLFIFLCNYFESVVANQNFDEMGKNEYARRLKQKHEMSTRNSQFCFK
jgi:hypothetical protein